MKPRKVVTHLCSMLLALLIAPSIGHAQEATLTGTVTDSTGGVLPGVTVTAVHESTGNRFVAVTDERGIYRIPARVGAYQLTAELSGFSTVARSGIQLLVGQTATIDLQMAPSTVQETVTVSAEAPLLNVATSNLGGNINPAAGAGTAGPGAQLDGARHAGARQPDDVGRRGDAAAGSEHRRAARVPAHARRPAGLVRARVRRPAALQPGLDRRVSVHLEPVRRDAGPVVGRAGSRDHALGHQHVLGLGPRQLPRQPLQRGEPGAEPRRADRQPADRVHRSAARSCATGCTSSGTSSTSASRASASGTRRSRRFNVELDGNDTVKLGGVPPRLPAVTGIRLMGKVSHGDEVAAVRRRRTPITRRQPARRPTSNREYLGSSRRCSATAPSTRSRAGSRSTSSTRSTSRPGRITGRRHADGLASGRRHTGSPRITFTGFTIAGNQFYPQDGVQTIWSVRDDFTFSYDARGRHDLKAGGEFLRYRDYGHSCRRCMGVIDARNGPLPANIEALFPDPFNADTWNLAAISPHRPHLRRRRRRLLHRRHPAADRRLAAGRLAGRADADAEPRRPLRPEPERQRQELQRAAVRRGRASPTTPTTSRRGSASPTS